MKTQNSFGKFDFVGKAGVFGGISLAFVVISLIYLAVKGISYGIDFRGGTEIQVRYAQTVTISEVRNAVENIGLKDASVQSIGEEHEFIVRFQGQKGQTDKETNELLNADIEKVKTALVDNLSAKQPDLRRVDTVGPQVGAELKRNGFLAVFYSLLVILGYIALRFDYKYAPGAVVCLAHDAIVTLAIFVAVGKEVNIPILAAILTLIGYSLNDTIVVFDRIRETENAEADKGMGFVINKAINDMLSRTVITSGTTFVSAICLFLFADGTVADIAFALCVGIFFGTYSSIYVAAPFILLVEKLGLVRKA
ncbi:MAG: protein translocase subunit SecF [Bdellovibrionia bacterium]